VYATCVIQFGTLLRTLRRKTGISIKKLAPQLGVNYSYLSRLENHDVGPSEEFIRKVADYFGYNNDLLLLSAGKVPADVLQILRTHPENALKILRQRFGRQRHQRDFA
jgi:HTH-type transcriptional regulator, competence development regulator